MAKSGQLAMDSLNYCHALPLYALQVATPTTGWAACACALTPLETPRCTPLHYVSVHCTVCRGRVADARHFETKLNLR
jgi:hypothetical protein